MAEEEAQAPEENAEATEAVEATGDAAAEAPDEAPKPQSVWMPIMASSVVSIAGAFALFHFVLGPKLVSGVAEVLGGGTALHAAHGEGEKAHGEGEKAHGEGEKEGHESGGGHDKADDADHGTSGSTDPDKDDSKGDISIVSDGESIVVNPANSGGMRYLLVDIYVVRANEEDKGFKAEIDQHSRELQALTMDELSSRDISNLSDPTVKTLIKDRLKKQYESVLKPFAPGKNRIGKLIISKWIMQ